MECKHCSSIKNQRNINSIIASYNHRMVWVRRDITDYLVPTSMPWAKTPYLKTSVTGSVATKISFHPALCMQNRTCLLALPSLWTSKANQQTPGFFGNNSHDKLWALELKGSKDATAFWHSQSLFLLCLCQALCSCFYFLICFEPCCQLVLEDFVI